MKEGLLCCDLGGGVKRGTLVLHSFLAVWREGECVIMESMLFGGWGRDVCFPTEEYSIVYGVTIDDTRQSSRSLCQTYR